MSAAPSLLQVDGMSVRYPLRRGMPGTRERTVDALREVAASYSATPGQVALAWILARPEITAPIASATTPEQARELAGAANLTLDAESLDMLDQVSEWR